MESTNLVVIYGISLKFLVEELWEADPGLINPFYADDAAFNELARQSAQLLNQLLERGPDLEYFPDRDKSLFIEDSSNQEEAAKRELEAEGYFLR